MRELVSVQSPEPSSNLILGLIAGMATVGVTLSTLLGVPDDPEWRAALYFLIGVVVTVLIAVIAERSQKLNIREFLMERVNSRSKRTSAVINICEEAKEVFKAVTYFPAVGIQDDPNVAPRKYLYSLEDRLANEVSVVLISVSCEEASQYCTEREFPRACIAALEKVEGRLTELIKFYPDRLTVITVPGSAITVNLCHNETTALLYHIATKDEGSGFKSDDPFVVSVAKGGVTRYETYGQRH